MLNKIKSKANQWISKSAPKSSVYKGPKMLTMCKSCYSYYDKKSWKIERPAYLTSDHDQDVPVHFTQCPACIEQELALYDMESDLVLGMRI